MSETRTPKQIAAADLCRAFEHLAIACHKFRFEFDENNVGEAGRMVNSLLPRVRVHMHPHDRARPETWQMPDDVAAGGDA